MDCLIKRFDAVPDDDLMICERRGVAYQRNMSRGRIAYDAKYLATYRGYAGSETERALNEGRVGLLARHVTPGARVLDVGVGSGAFMRAAIAAGFEAYGNDVNPDAVAALRADRRFAESAEGFDAVTFWDSLEHIEDPHLSLAHVRKGALLLAAIPLIEDLGRVRASKHWKPGEHLMYFTDAGFVEWMAMHGFRLLERSAHETAAGREAIGAYAFRKDLPEWRDYIDAYTDMHASRHYGSSATELHLATAAKVVRQLRPRSILDYGCGRSDLVAHFWRDGERRIERFDPAIPMFKRLPSDRFDLVLCCDVMEHVPMSGVDRVLSEIRSKSDRVFFTISTKLARARLPDGSNAHCTLLTASEWSRWIRDVFGGVRALPSHSEHELVLVAGRDVPPMALAA